uniref:Retrotransposon gag domain-containing protein n=1 Tax=Cacopsylla melanoneura TaxID=428564 RepID=A0A8D8UYJ8_9HEMI
MKVLRSPVSLHKIRSRLNYNLAKLRNWPISNPADCKAKYEILQQVIHAMRQTLGTIQVKHSPDMGELVDENTNTTVGGSVISISSLDFHRNGSRKRRRKRSKTNVVDPVLDENLVHVSQGYATSQYIIHPQRDAMLQDSENESVPEHNRNHNDNRQNFRDNESVRSSTHENRNSHYSEDINLVRGIQNPVNNDHNRYIKDPKIYKWNLKFSGSNMSLDDFLDELDLKRCSRMVSYDDILLCCGELFEGEARLWYMSRRHEFDSWDHLVQALRKSFGNRNDDLLLLQEILGRKQRKDETVVIYVATMRILMNRLPLEFKFSLPKQIEIIKRNALCRYQQALLFRPIATLNQLESDLKILEELDEPEKNITKSNFQLSNSNNNLCDEVNRYSSRTFRNLSMKNYRFRKPMSNGNINNVLTNSRNHHYNNESRNFGNLYYLQKYYPPKQQVYDKQPRYHRFDKSGFSRHQSRRGCNFFSPTLNTSRQFKAETDVRFSKHSLHNNDLNNNTEAVQNVQPKVFNNKSSYSVKSVDDPNVILSEPPNRYKPNYRSNYIGFMSNTPKC